MLRQGAIERGEKVRAEFYDKVDFRVRNAGAFNHLLPVRHTPITQEEINDHSWAPTLRRIGGTRYFSLRESSDGVRRSGVHCVVMCIWSL